MDVFDLPEQILSRPFTVSEGRLAGLSSHQLQRPELLRPTRGVRILDPPTTLVERARAMLAGLPEGTMLSHITAAQLLGIPFPSAADDSRIHVVRPITVSQIRRPGLAGHRAFHPRRSVVVSGLPVVAPADTWVDLGEYVGRGKPMGLDDLIVAGDAAASLLGTTAPLREALAARTRPRGKVTLSYALLFMRVGSRSALESRSRLMIVRAGLPEPKPNVAIISRRNLFLGLVDLAWEEERVVAEAQSLTFHGAAEARHKDGVRRQDFETDGWAFVEIWNDDVFDKQRRDAKLVELAGKLRFPIEKLNLYAAEPQFHAPAQFARPRRRRAS